MIKRIAGVLFHEHYVTFHMQRDNPHAPWRCIGICDVYHDKAHAKYLNHFKYMKKTFEAEAEKAGRLSGTYEFMDTWHKRHQDLNSPVSKVIRFWSTMEKPYDVVRVLGERYLGDLDSTRFGMMAIMLKSREAYFPIVFNRRSEQRPKVVAELKKQGYIK